jgi:hypothetical protein
MRGTVILGCLSLVVLAGSNTCRAGDGNRLVYLQEGDPYYVGRDFPKLTTPQWVGEEGIEAVAVLAVDDMQKNTPRYETFLRPILERLKAIDGRAPVSIMTCTVDPSAPMLQRWIKEGVNLDVHTLTHRHPLLQQADFAAAKQTVEGGIDLLSAVPNNRPVAFRMPYCDSTNSPSPRFFAEIFNVTSPEGHFLTIDSSVFHLFTPADDSLPRALVAESDGRERFRKYLPFPSFVNTIENYPYPYVIGRLCWEFPGVVPSDWEAQNLHGKTNPKTIADMEAALDLVAQKQGVFNLVFHPHGWVTSAQVIELIDHAVVAHEGRVKFLNFREAQERLDQNLLGGQSLRAPDGQDNGVRLLDLDHDGYLDVVIGNASKQETRLWEPARRRWRILGLPTALVARDAQGHNRDLGVRFGIVDPDGRATMLVRTATTEDTWHFDGSGWRADRALLAGLEGGRGWSLDFRDIDGDGRCELMARGPLESEHGAPAGPPPILAWSDTKKAWEKLPFTLPPAAVTAQGRAVGVRFVDLNDDGRDDLVFSRGGSDARWGIYLFESPAKGWSRVVAEGGPGDPGALPPIAISRADGTTEDNGLWVHSRHLWWQNENTDKLPDGVDRRSFKDLLKAAEARR